MKSDSAPRPDQGDPPTDETTIVGPEPLELREISFAHHELELAALRGRVWRRVGRLADSEAPDRQFIDQWESRSRHWGWFHEGQLVASGRLTVGHKPEDVPYGTFLRRHIGAEFWPLAVLTRLVVDSEHERRGLGSGLDKLRLEAAKAAGARAACAITFTRPEMLFRSGWQKVYELSVPENHALDSNLKAVLEAAGGGGGGSCCRSSPDSGDLALYLSVIPGWARIISTNGVKLIMLLKPL